jgi:hypothetical protein
MSEPKRDRETRIIAVGTPEALTGKRTKTDRERAWEAANGRTILDERWKQIDLIFSEGGLKKMGYGDKTVATLVSSGAAAKWAGYIKTTLGGGLIGEKYPISTDNRDGLDWLLVKYQRIRESRTILNETTHQISCKKANICHILKHSSRCPGVLYAPGEVMFDGQDSPLAKELALLSLQALAHQICKSFYERHVSTEVLAPEDKPNFPVDPRTGKPIIPYPYGYPNSNFPVEPLTPKKKIEIPEVEDE